MTSDLQQYMVSSGLVAARYVSNQILNMNEDPYIALLAYCNIPLKCDASPAQLLFGRTLRERVAVTNNKLSPKLPNHKEIREKMAQEQQRQKNHYDQRHNSKAFQTMKMIECPSNLEECQDANNSESESEEDSDREFNVPLSILHSRVEEMEETEVFKIIPWTEKVIQKIPTGYSEQTVRQDSKINVVQWYDQKPVLLASTELGTDPTDECKR
ncbi:hypothetical protein ILUMI_10721 [Ignelater luminosus]|uniref:Uncharacterized protein n=1 Tax=Ignelater luminosus TaxID=2038154 RepID=A0A8K0CXK3_IGNLU|nr:hypothetical protein ILUMI_10721 [Ignelater luminosus]